MNYAGNWPLEGITRMPEWIMTRPDHELGFGVAVPNRRQASQRTLRCETTPGPLLSIGVDADGRFVSICATRLDKLISESDRRTLEMFRREELGACDPLTLTLAAGPARVVREPPGGLRRGDAIYVALVGEWSRADEWKDFFLHDHCTDPSPDADFGVCLDVHGQMLGVILEGSRVLFPRALDEIHPWDAQDTRWPA